MNNPQTWTTVWELTVGGGMGRGGQRGKNWDNCNSINNKMLNEKYYKIITYFISTSSVGYTECLLEDQEFLHVGLDNFTIKLYFFCISFATTVLGKV